MRCPSLQIGIPFVFLVFILWGCLEETTGDDLLKHRFDEVYCYVEDMPRFPGCEHLQSKSEKVNCSRDKRDLFVDSLLILPPEVLVGKVEGKGVVSFIVDVNGELLNPKVEKSVCALCDEQMPFIVRSMPRWIPGEQRGEKIRVRVYLPVWFER